MKELLMGKRYWITVTLLVSVICGDLTAQTRLRERAAAFPGAEGFGAVSRGGRGGRAILVTSLADYGADDKPIEGTLRAACETEGARTVIFRTAGEIRLRRPLKITKPYLTLAGQSAPGDGICVSDYGCLVGTHDVVMRYMRFRRGDRTGSVGDGICLTAAHEVIIDHCSVSWGNDEVLSVSGANQSNITVQWCFITESLDESSHKKGHHAYGTLLRTNGRVAFHHNLYAHHRTRCPRLGTYGQNPGLTIDFRNNIIYNWINPAGYSAADPVTGNYIGNYLKPGPSTTSRLTAFQVGGQTTRLFVEGNFMEGLGVQPENPWGLIDRDKPENRLNEHVPTALVKTEAAPVAFKRVMAEGGATRPVRDDVDKRIVRDVCKGLGNVINSQASVGAWPKYAGTCDIIDEDSDGLPDTWEARHGLDPTLASDNRDDPDGDGYTNLEEWLNMTEPQERDSGVLTW